MKNSRMAEGSRSCSDMGQREMKWWEKPGIGIQYQIEYRPGWEWNRNFEKFNKSMSDDQGRLAFNGPFCKIDDWVALSREIGADYHMMESKWHDGICFFNTRLTDWKTQVDYAGEFAESSRTAGIPFMYYYSSIFDHNPQFDSIQPNRRATFSLIGSPRQPIYEEYLRGHYHEIMEQYHPDGMWIDWYWPGDGATRTTIAYFRERHPDTVLVFNASHYFPSAHGKLHYTSGEAHDLDGFFVKLYKSESALLFIFKSAWKWASMFRRLIRHPWELITPAGTWWSDPSQRADPNELLRMAAVVMANGGKLCIGASSLLDGSIYPNQQEQLRRLGEWYKPRRGLFTESVPMRYLSETPPGISGLPGNIHAVACHHAGDIILHLINMTGSPAPVRLKLSGPFWSGISHARLEPEHSEMAVRNHVGVAEIILEPEDINHIDTIIRFGRNQ